jgi:IS1 family transposase
MSARPATTPGRPTTSWSPFPPRTTEVQFDEKWSFVAKKEEHCDRSDPADDHKGDYWDHVAFDPEHRLVVAVVPGARDVEGTETLVGEFRRRTGGRTMRLMTSDAYSAYETAILDAYGETVVPPRTGKPGRPKGPSKVPPAGLVYATVEKRKAKGRVAEILTHVVFGTMAAVVAALAGSRVSRSINTSFLERQNLTDRHHNARKSRKTYRFSKDWRFHEAATYFTMYSYNFCWPVRTLREPIGEGHWRKRTPAMAAGLTNHVWSISEWISFPALLRS